MATVVRLAGFDIVLRLTTVGATKADNPSDARSINESQVVENPFAWRERDHSLLAAAQRSSAALLGIELDTEFAAAATTYGHCPYVGAHDGTLG
jgi:hypothetical protein